MCISLKITPEIVVPVPVSLRRSPKQVSSRKHLTNLSRLSFVVLATPTHQQTACNTGMARAVLSYSALQFMSSSDCHPSTRIPGELVFEFRRECKVFQPGKNRSRLKTNQQSQQITAPMRLEVIATRIVVHRNLYVIIGKAFRVHYVHDNFYISM